MICVATTVRKERWKNGMCFWTWAKKSRAAIPITNQGRISGAPTRPPMTPRLQNLNRVRPKAMSVPITRHAGATMNATKVELKRAVRSTELPKASEYQWLAKPLQGREMITELLKEK